MRSEQARQIHSSAELSIGDEIEAWHNGKLFHRGQVSQTVASMDLFWMVDAKTGTRRLIDVEALVILRAARTETKPAGTVAKPAGAGTAGSLAAGAGSAGSLATGAGSRPAAAEPAARAPGRPTSHIPLFQAPSLVL